MKKNSKNVIVEAAISLFNRNGFNGTSIRDIASYANVNIANISYYFQNKRGLLEYCFTIFFEQYLSEIEKGYVNLDTGATNALKSISKNLIHFQSEKLHLTRFILREISIDSQMVREIMSTYFAKERYYLTKVFEHGMKTGEFQPFSINYTLIQYKALLSMPYLNSQYAGEVLTIFPQEKYFADRYTAEIHRWIDCIIACSTNEKELIAQN